MQLLMIYFKEIRLKFKKKVCYPHRVAPTCGRQNKPSMSGKPPFTSVYLKKV